jgi:Sec-independent protein translocase protein TatA
MELFNIGPLELIVVLLVMFFLLGPKGMILTAQKIGSWIRGFVRSPMWREIMGYSQEIRELPKRIMDDTGLQEALDDVKQTTKQTATELNSTVNEAMQAARVPEAEHVRISTTDVTGPSAEAIPAPKSEVELLAEKVRAANAETAKALLESTSIAKPGTTGAADAAAAVEGQPEVQEPVAVEGSQPAVDEIQPAANEIQAAANEVQPAAKRRGRPRKVALTAEEAPVAQESNSEAAVLAPDEPAVPPTHRPRVKKSLTTAKEGVEIQPSVAVEPQQSSREGDEPQPVVTRRGRPRKATAAVVADRALVDAAPEGEFARTVVLETPLESAPAPRKERVRLGKNAAVVLPPAADVTEPVHEQAPTIETAPPAPRKPRGRPRKDRDTAVSLAETTSVDTSAVSLSDNAG